MKLFVIPLPQVIRRFGSFTDDVTNPDSSSESRCCKRRSVTESAKCTQDSVVDGYDADDFRTASQSGDAKHKEI